MKVGDTVHGFVGGYFGRDSYACRQVEAVGPDWVVTRNASGLVEMSQGARALEACEAALDDRSYCGCPPNPIWLTPLVVGTRCSVACPESACRWHLHGPTRSGLQAHYEVHYREDHGTALDPESSRG